MKQIGVLIMMACVICSAEAGLEVYYIPGWLKAKSPHPEIEKLLGEVFPGAMVKTIHWEGNDIWGKSVKNADDYSAQLAKELADMPQERRERTVLVGHSLGGRITVRCLARLAERKMRIRQGILLSAAIPYRDGDVDLALEAGRERLVNVINPDDVTLKYIYGAMGGEKQAALGANGYLKPDARYLELVVPEGITEEVEFEGSYIMKSELVKRVANHHVLFPLSYLKSVGKAKLDEIEQRIVVPQDYVNMEMPVLDAGLWWDVMDKIKGWKLEKNIVTGLYRILDDKGCRQAWGRKEEMLKAFEKVRKQLE